jgi:hypothetical protein
MNLRKALVILVFAVVIASCAKSESELGSGAPITAISTSTMQATSTSTTIPLNPEYLLALLKPSDLDLRSMERFSVTGFTNWTRSSEWAEEATSGVTTFCDSPIIFNSLTSVPKAGYTWRENSSAQRSIIDVEIYEFPSSISSNDYFDRWALTLRECTGKTWMFGGDSDLPSKTRTIDGWAYTEPNRPTNLKTDQGMSNMSDSVVVSESILSITDIEDTVASSRSSDASSTLHDLYIRVGRFVVRVGGFSLTSKMTSNRLLGAINVAAGWPLAGLQVSKLRTE